MAVDNKGFSALAVRLSDQIKAISYLFVRRHVDEASSNDGAALFVAGLPVVQHPMTAAVEAVFSAFGEVLSTVVHQSQLSALVLFKDEASVEKVLRTAAAGSIVDAPLVDPEEPHGLKGWIAAHKAKFPGNAALKKQLNDWMEAYEQREAEAARQSAEDDDGWTVVARRPGRKKTKDSDSSVAVGGISKAAAEAMAKKPVKQLENFYRHQRQEKKREELMSLRSKFEEDKKRIAEMRANRRFKPY